MSNKQRKNNTNNKGNQEISWVSNKNPAHEKLIGGYRETPKIILIQPHLSSTEKLLFTEILYYYRLSCERGYNFAIPSQETLANNLGVSQKTVRYASQNLVEHKLLQIETRKHIWGHKLQYSFPPTYPPQVFENYIKYERQNLKRLHDQNKPQEAIEQKQQLLRMLHVKEKEAQTQSYLKREDPSVLEAEDPSVLEAEDPSVLEAEDPSVLGTSSKGSNSQPPEKEKSAPIYKSSIYKSNNHQSAKSDDDKNFKKQKDASQTIQNNPEMSFNPGDSEQNNVSNEPRGTQTQRGNSSAPHEGKTQHDNMHTCSKKARQLTEHIDDELRRNGCQALSRKALERIPAQIDQFLKEYPFGLIVESIDEVVENLGNSNQSSKKISSAKYFLSTIEDKQEDWEYRRKEQRKIAAAFKRRMEAEDE